MHMEILIQRTKSALYLQSENSWTTDPEHAITFVSSDQAIAYCQANRISDVMLALKFEDSRFDLTIPLEPPKAPLRPAEKPATRRAACA